MRDLARSWAPRRVRSTAAPRRSVL
jgi:hypothetical protein